MPESTISPQSGIKNLATVKKKLRSNITGKHCILQHTVVADASQYYISKACVARSLPHVVPLADYYKSFKFMGLCLFSPRVLWPSPVPGDSPPALSAQVGIRFTPQVRSRVTMIHATGRNKDSLIDLCTVHILWESVKNVVLAHKCTAKVEKNSLLKQST